MSELSEPKVADGFVGHSHRVVAGGQLDGSDVGIAFAERSSGQIGLIGSFEDRRLIVLDVRVIAGEHQRHVAASFASKDPQLGIGTSDPVGIIQIEDQRTMGVDSQCRIGRVAGQLLDGVLVASNREVEPVDVGCPR